MQEETKKKNLTNNFSIPYPIGTYVYKIEDDRIKIEQIYEYILDNKGMSVRLLLRPLSDYPSISVKIELERFLNTYHEYKNDVRKRSAKAEAEKLAKEIKNIFSDDDIDLHIEVKEQSPQLAKKPKKDNKGNN